MTELRLDSGESTLVITQRDGLLGMPYIGAKLAADTDLSRLALLTAPVIPHGELDRPAHRLAFPTRDGRPCVLPALLLRRGGRECLTDLRIRHHSADPGRITVQLCDALAAVEICLTFEACGDGVFGVRTGITNIGDEAISVDWLASAHIPLPDRFSRVKTNGGFWANEFQGREGRLGDQEQSWISDRGRSSHGSSASFIIGTEHLGEEHGEALQLALCWPGNHRLATAPAECGAHGAQAGVLLDGGELVLNRGDSYQAPSVLLSWSAQGLNGLRASMGSYWRRRAAARRPERPRPVHFNSWEGCYFEHDETRMLALVEQARAIGAERFVLDDGWMAGRTGAGVGLGDWRPCAQRYPRGLAPIADAVRASGMEFGLWVEPEMVTPDSYIAAQHPHWVVAAEGREAVAGRSQYLLDIGSGEVRAYIGRCLDKLVSETHPSYIKWDMNRDYAQTGAASSTSTMAMTQGFIALVDGFHERHPDIELELCGAGGARSDGGTMIRADRLWPTDSLDPVLRWRVLRNASLLLPPAFLGWHVGTARSETSGATLPLSTRCMLAVLGHMGIELDPVELAADDLSTLTRWLEFFKEERLWLQHADYFFRDPNNGDGEALVVADQERHKALLVLLQSAYPQRGAPALITLPELDEARSYRLHYLTAADNRFAQVVPGWVDEQPDAIPGNLLRQVGIRPPPLRYGHAAMLCFTAED